MWCLLGMAHLLVAMALLVACWAMQVTPGDVSEAILSTTQKTPVAVLSALGVSGGTLFAGYVWLMRRLLRYASQGWLSSYLMAGV